MKHAIVVGSGAGGAAIARELAGFFRVTILEEGKAFRPLSFSMPFMESLKATGLLLDERMTNLLFPPMRIRRASGGMALVNGRCVGGTTTISAGNALRMDHDLKEIGVDLDAEFEQLSRELPISAEHERGWRADTRELFNVCRGMGLSPRPTPKLIDFRKCRRCGRCILGCPSGAKWDAGAFVREALERGARLVNGCRVEKVQVEGTRATGVWAVSGRKRSFMPADVVVVAAGGFDTPGILRRSGVRCGEGLFVDPVLCIAGRREGTGPRGEIAMPFVIQQDGYIVSPYFDYLSYFYNRRWRRPGSSVLSLMVKLADSGQRCSQRQGSSKAGSKIQKELSSRDTAKLREGVQLCRQILLRLGVSAGSLVPGTVNAGHPGGTVPLTPADAPSLHPSCLPGNLFVSDASLLPRSLGNPPILTVMALAIAVGKRVKQAA